MKVEHERKQLTLRARPTMTRGRKALLALLRRLLRDNRVPVSGTRAGYRRSLKGSLESRSAACRCATDFLSRLNLAPEAKPFPTSLRVLVAELRQQAGDIKLTASVRLLAISRLCLIEGLNVDRQNDATEQVICEACGIGDPPAKPDSLTTQDVRAAARRQALTEVRNNYLTDAREGRFAGLDHAQVADALRYDDTAPVEMPSLTERNKEIIAECFEAFRNAGKGRK